MAKQSPPKKHLLTTEKLTLVAILGVLAIGILGFVSWFTSGKQGPLGFRDGHTATSYTVDFRIKTSDDLSHQYVAAVTFYDSMDPSSVCPSKLEGFQGGLTIKYPSAEEARIEAVQNMEPRTESHSNRVPREGSICAAVVVEPSTESVVIDKKWLESTSENKTLKINDEPYSVSYDDSAKTVAISHGDRTWRPSPSDNRR